MADRLDPQVRAIVDAIATAGAPAYSELSPEEARAAHNDKAPLLGAPFVELAAVDDHVIDGPAGPIPARLYRPAGGDSPTAALVFYHGGGHVIGSLASYDTLCRQLAHQSNVGVLSVDYRLAPEHRFPAAVDDAFAAYRWARERGGEVGIDPGRLAIGGDSAGGNLAAVVAILGRDAGLPTPAHQLLVYPATAAYPETPSHLEFADGHVLTRQVILWFHEHYLDYGRGDHTDWRWAPLLAPDLTALPSTTVILAECDPLRDEGIDYARRLAISGNDVTLRVYPGTTHPFFSWSGAVDKARHAVTFAAQQLAQAMAGLDGGRNG
jgi:acetyl esterase